MKAMIALAVACFCEKALPLSGVPLFFSSNTTHYTAQVSHSTLATTVTALASNAEAGVVIAPVDAEPTLRDTK